MIYTLQTDSLCFLSQFSNIFRTQFLPGQSIPDLSGADDLLGLSGEVTPGLLPFDASLAPYGVGVDKTWLGADGGGMEFLEWLMRGDDSNLISG
jgi:hypothetical protein